jgi:hypothetical protein
MIGLLCVRVRNESLLDCPEHRVLPAITVRLLSEDLPGVRVMGGDVMRLVV